MRRRTAVVAGIVLLLAITPAFAKDTANKAQTASKAKTEFRFPKKIEFDVLHSGAKVGSCAMSHVARGKHVLLALVDFEALGQTKDDKLQTALLKDTLSLDRSALVRGPSKTKLWEIHFTKAMTFEGSEGDVYQYTDPESSSAMETEIYSEHKVVDLLAVLYLACARVTSGEHLTPALFNLFIEKSTQIVEMVSLGKVESEFNEEKVEVSELGLRWNDTEIFRIQVLTDADGYTFPLSVKIDRPGVQLSIRAAGIYH